MDQHHPTLDHGRKGLIMSTLLTLHKTLDRKRVQLSFLESPSLTKQSFKDECDVNQILRRWRRSGELTHLEERSPTYGDFSNATDYLTATLAVQAAQADFDALSARIRKRMNNDPAELLEFVADPKNREEAIELGLIEKPASEPPPAETPADPPPEPPPAPVAGGE